MDSLSGWHVCLNYFSSWLPSAHITYSPRTHWSHLFIPNLGYFSPHSVYHVYTKMPFSCFESWLGAGIGVKTMAGCGDPEWTREDDVALQGTELGQNRFSLLRYREDNEDDWISLALCIPQHPPPADMWLISVRIPEPHNTVLNQVNLRLPTCTEHFGVALKVDRMKSLGTNKSQQPGSFPGVHSEYECSGSFTGLTAG